MDYNTNNPVGSTDPRDLYDNAGNLDKFVNGDSPFYPDRLGKQRISWSGMEYQFDNAQVGRASEFEASQVLRTNQFSSSQAEQSAQFQAFLESSGFVWVGDYAAGVEFTTRTQYTVREGVLYRPAPSTALPHTLTGVWATDQSFLVAFSPDDALRQELLSNDLMKGSALVGRSVRAIWSMAELRTSAGRFNGDIAHLVAYHDDWGAFSNPRPLGGGKFIWDSTSTAADDSGMVIQVTGVATGRWVRQTDSKTRKPCDFGAKADGASDDTAAFDLLAATLAPGCVVDLSGEAYWGELTVSTASVLIKNGTINAGYAAIKAAVYVHDADHVTVSNVKTVVDNANRNLYTAANMSGIHYENCGNVKVTGCLAIGSKNTVYNDVDPYGATIHAWQCNRVVFENCITYDGHGEGIMSHLCDDVWINNCQGYNCGGSNIGTSGGNKAQITNCYSFSSGFSGISFNSQNGLVEGNTIEGNQQAYGLIVGHNHIASSYAQDVVVTGNHILNAFDSGINVSVANRVTLTGNQVNNAGGYGIVVNDFLDSANGMATVVGNTIFNSVLSGIRVVASPGLTPQVLVSGNNIRKCGEHGIRVEVDGTAKISDNEIDDVTFGVQSFQAFTSVSAAVRGEATTVSNNTIRNCKRQGIVTLGQKYVYVTDNRLTNYNTSASAGVYAIGHVQSLASVNRELPDYTEYRNNTLIGNNGAGGGTSFQMFTDGLATTGKILRVESNYASDGSTALLAYPSARQALAIKDNNRGSGAQRVLVSVPAAGALVVNNSNQLSQDLPRLVSRNGIPCFVSTFADGTLTLQNINGSSASVMLIW